MSTDSSSSRFGLFVGRDDPDAIESRFRVNAEEEEDDAEIDEWIRRVMARHIRRMAIDGYNIDPGRFMAGIVPLLDELYNMLEAFSEVEPDINYCCSFGEAMFYFSEDEFAVPFFEYIDAEIFEDLLLHWPKLFDGYRIDALLEYIATDGEVKVNHIERRIEEIKLNYSASTPIQVARAMGDDFDDLKELLISYANPIEETIENFSVIKFILAGRTYRVPAIQYTIYTDVIRCIRLCMPDLLSDIGFIALNNALQ